MEKILSQDEIDALLNGVVSGEVETAPAAEAAAEATTGVKGYDLLNQERIIRGRMPTLEMINDRFVRRQAVAWTGVLREAIEFVVVGTQVIKFGEFLKKIPMPSSLNVFHMAPLRGSGLFVMDAFLVYLLVDYFFGGKGQTHVKPEGRDFTAVQVRMIKKLLMLALADLEKAWQAILPVKVDYVRSESNPQFAMVVTASEVVIVVTSASHHRGDHSGSVRGVSLFDARAYQGKALLRAGVGSVGTGWVLEQQIPRLDP